MPHTQLTLVAFLAAAGGAEAFAGQAARAVLPASRSATPAMQFFGGGKKKDAPTKSSGGGAFFDDERDTVSKPAWDPFANEKRMKEKGFRSEIEAAGFNDDGDDLANTGGVIYLAAVPFFFLAVFYLFGAVGSPYGNYGNF